MMSISKPNLHKQLKLSFLVVLTITVITALMAGGASKLVYADSKAPDFNLKTLDGNQVSLQSFQGKPLILWFMAAWCPSCVSQASAIKQVSSEYGNKLNVLVVDLWAAQNIGQGAQGLNAETGNDLQAFIAKNGSPQWIAALDTDRATIKYGITQVDSTVVVDGNGKIAFMNLGPSGYQPLKDALTKMVI